MIPIFAVIKKELTSVLRDRTIIISILIQLFIASFSSALLLGMLSLYDADTVMKYAGSNFHIGMVGATDNPMTSALLQRGLDVIEYSTFAEAQAAMFRNEVSAIFVLPADATGQINLYLPDSDAISALIRMVIQEPLKQYENYLRAENGITVRYTNLQGKPSTSYEFVYSVLIPMLMLFPAFVAGSMTVDSITEEVENKTMQTLLSAPLTVNGMIGAKIAAAVLISTAQCVAWLGLMRLNGIYIQNQGWILALAMIVAGILSAGAALSAALLKDRERSQFVYSLALLAATSIATLLNLSPITTLARLAVGDFYTNGWNVAIFGAFLAALYFVLSKTSNRMIA